MYKNILFDLDGTLTDPAEGITNSVAYALSKWGIEPQSRESLYKYIGPPLIPAFEEYNGFTREQAEKSLTYYREYFTDKGIYENKMYKGVPELLEELKRRGKKLILATSKPEDFAVIILKHFGIYEYFDFVSGATMDEKRVKKADVIEYALESCGITDAEECLMVGDREHDVYGARERGIDCVGVLYGYGSEEELRKAGARYIAPTLEDILNAI